MSWFMTDPSNAHEIGAVAHGPMVIARNEGITVALRSITAFSSGLEIAVTVVGRGIHAEAVQRQYTAPAVTDPQTGRSRPGPKRGRPMNLRALDDPVLQPVMRGDSQGWYNTANLYQREYLYEISGLPNTRHLPLIAKWPEVGLDPATIDLLLPEPAAALAASIIPLI